LGWANETWSGVWHGLSNKILVEQTYPGMEDIQQHFRALEEAFHDSRYLRIDGKPLFIVYRPERLPDAIEFTATWREMSVASGLPGIYFLGIFENLLSDPKVLGFDAKSGHFPGSGLGPAQRRRFSPRSRMRDSRPTVMDYGQYVANVSRLFREVPDLVPCVVPNWDNTPRSGKRGLVLGGVTPDLFREQLEAALEAVSNKRQQERIVLLKSWNEWAEGNYLEPDSTLRDAFLKVVRSCLL
jgi:hypothetical protein